jgi:hypothetical protein
MDADTLDRSLREYLRDSTRAWEVQADAAAAAATAAATAAAAALAKRTHDKAFHDDLDGLQGMETAQATVPARGATSVRAARSTAAVVRNPGSVGGSVGGPGSSRVPASERGKKTPLPDVPIRCVGRLPNPLSFQCDPDHDPDAHMSKPHLDWLADAHESINSSYTLREEYFKTRYQTMRKALNVVAPNETLDHTRSNNRKICLFHHWHQQFPGQPYDKEKLYEKARNRVKTRFIPDLKQGEQTSQAAPGPTPLFEELYVTNCGKVYEFIEAPADTGNTPYYRSLLQKAP